MTQVGFNLLFEKMIKSTGTYQEAYEKAEQQHLAKYGNNRYSCYDTFRNVRKRLIKRGRR
jgi:hypothetical protein